jgi:hypothetical protein
MHRNARLTPAGRLLLCQRIEAGWPVAYAIDVGRGHRISVWRCNSFLSVTVKPAAWNPRPASQTRL